MALLKKNRDEDEFKKKEKEKIHLEKKNIQKNKMQGARALVTALTRQYHTVLLKALSRWQYQSSCNYYQNELLIKNKNIKKCQKIIHIFEKEKKKFQDKEKKLETHVVDLETERDALLLRTFFEFLFLAVSTIKLFILVNLTYINYLMESHGNTLFFFYFFLETHVFRKCCFWLSLTIKIFITIKSLHIFTCFHWTTLFFFFERCTSSGRRSQRI